MAAMAAAFAKAARMHEPQWRPRPEYSAKLRIILRWCLGLPTEGLDLAKGLWLYGDVGTGKTTLLLAVKQFPLELRAFDPRLKFGWFNAQELASTYANGGESALSPMIEAPGLAIDEIGSETRPANHYGTTMDVISYLLQRRYDRRHCDGFVTHATSNYRPEQLASIYSPRIADRCKEMFNFIEFSGESFRK